MTWHTYALIAAVTGGAAAVLIKAGAAPVPATTVVLFRTAIILVFSMVAAVWAGEHRSWRALPLRALGFLALSAVATGLSWLAYVRGVQVGPVAGVSSIDRLGLIFAVLFAAVWLGEAVTWRMAAGVLLMIAGALLVVRP